MIERHGDCPRARAGRLLGGALVLLSGIGLAGCFGIGTTAAIATGATATVIAEDKLPTDFVAEAVTGQDCNYIRHLEDKGPLCRPKQRQVIERPVYCYRTLADIECYAERDPYGIGQREVN